MIYQEILHDIIQWAKNSSPPQYHPDWMINHGLGILVAAMKGEAAPDPYNSGHVPQRDWEEAIRFLEEFVNDEEIWKKFEADVKPENAANTLEKRNEQIIQQYSQYLDSEKAEKLRDNLDKITDLYYTESGTVAERMITVTDEIEKFLMGFSFNDSFQNNDSLAQATLRTLSTAAETYATSHGGQYPTSMKLLTDDSAPYINADYCNKTESGFIYTCYMDNEGYTFTATPVTAGETGSTTYSISTGGVMTP